MGPEFIRICHWTYWPKWNGKKHRMCKQRKRKSQAVCLCIIFMWILYAIYAEVRDQPLGSQLPSFSLFREFLSFYFFTIHTIAQSQVPVWSPLSTFHITSGARIVAVSHHIQLCVHSGGAWSHEACKGELSPSEPSSSFSTLTLFLWDQNKMHVMLRHFATKLLFYLKKMLFLVFYHDDSIYLSKIV